MSEHKAPRIGDRVGVSKRAKAREIMFRRRRLGTPYTWAEHLKRRKAERKMST